MEIYDPRHDLRALGRFLRDQWWVVLICALAGGAAGLGATLLKETEYEASTTVLVQADPIEKLVGLSDDFSPIGDPTLPGSAMETQVGLVRQRSLATVVRRRLGTEQSASELLDNVRGEKDTVSSLLRIVARQPSAADAERLANAWAAAMVRDARSRQDRRIEAAIALLRTELGQRSETPAVRDVLRGQLRRLSTLRAVAQPPLRVIQPAEAGGAPVSPRRAVALSMGLLIGFVIGLGVSLVRHLGLQEALAGPGRETATPSA
jgi:uncharacterized protein involved in exopolysaccharide biosynthesis